MTERETNHVKEISKALTEYAVKQDRLRTDESMAEYGHGLAFLGGKYQVDDDGRARVAAALMPLTALARCEDTGWLITDPRCPNCNGNGVVGVDMTAAECPQCGGCGHLCDPRATPDHQNVNLEWSATERRWYARCACGWLTGPHTGRGRAAVAWIDKHLWEV